MVRDGDDRIIPAYAGSTSPDVRRHDSRQDHPRIRGEHLTAYSTMTRTRGSSPHTRGAPQSCRWSSLNVRIIPAYAGSTRLTRWMGRRWRDHPRIRGEHVDGRDFIVDAPGSSPHTRGAPLSYARAALGEGIIPAYAGSTASGRVWRPRFGDHPRIRGEHDCSIYFTNFPTGSSPHTRGARGAG